MGTRKTGCRQERREIPLRAPVVMVLVTVANNLGFLPGIGELLELLYFSPRAGSVPVRLQRSVGAWMDSSPCEGHTCKRSGFPLPAREFCMSREVDSR